MEKGMKGKGKEGGKDGMMKGKGKGKDGKGKDGKGMKGGKDGGKGKGKGGKGKGKGVPQEDDPAVIEDLNVEECDAWMKDKTWPDFAGGKWKFFWGRDEAKVEKRLIVSNDEHVISWTEMRDDGKTSERFKKASFFWDTTNKALCDSKKPGRYFISALTEGKITWKKNGATKYGEVLLDWEWDESVEELKLEELEAKAAERKAAYGARDAGKGGKGKDGGGKGKGKDGGKGIGKDGKGFFGKDGAKGKGKGKEPLASPETTTPAETTTASPVSDGEIVEEPTVIAEAA